MKNIYKSMLAVALGVVILQIIYSVSLNAQIDHYKNLYLEANKTFEDHLLEMHSDSKGHIIVVVHDKK